MKILQSLLVFAFITLSSVGYSQIETEVSFIQEWDTTRVLKNPYKGWYHHLLDNAISRYSIKDDSIFASFPGMDHLYLRLCWSYLEPEEGKFDWHYIDEVVEKYVSKGYKISFRISCSETGSYPNSVGEEFDGVQYATPSWVKKAGAKGTIAHHGKLKIWVPKWDDPVYLEKLDQFHKAFAARYDGKSWVSYVDIGSVGTWGEGHTGYTTEIPPTMAEVKANLDIYLKNYKKSQLIVAYGYLFVGKTKKEEQELFQYAISKGISLRCDSNMVPSYMQRYMKTWTHSHPHYYDPLYIQMPIVFELAHYVTVKKDGSWLGKNGADTIEQYGYSSATILRKAIETMHASYIGYHGYAEEWLSDNPELTKELANLCGYWYFPVSASFPKVMNRDENEFSIVWLNKGIAPAYNEFTVIFRFESKDTNNSFEVLANSGNKNWLPGIGKTEKYQLEIPSKVKKGGYILKFRLEEQTEESSQPVQIGIKESVIDAKGFVELGPVTIE